MTTQRAAIVTGASSGIGAAIARQLANAGCAVLVNYSRNCDGAEAVANSCRDAGADAVVVQGDIASDEDCRALVSAALESWGRIDVLINNAGVTRFADANDLEALCAEDFARIFSVNVAGTYQMTRAAKSALRKTGGAVVNISSHSGFPVLDPPWPTQPRKERSTR